MKESNEGARRQAATASIPDDQVLAGAKFYARASAERAVWGVIPDFNDEADDANWECTREDIREGCIKIVRGILVAARIREVKRDA